mgnify:CR=1 FL=1
MIKFLFISKKLQSILFLMFIFQLAFAQNLPPENFYKHFKGNINNTINISANIIKLQDTLYGNYYYWYFEHESNDKHISAEIPLQGKMLSPTEFTLSEYIETGSHFDGIFSGTNQMEGTWENEEAGKSLSFEMIEKYPRGSMAFEIQRLKSDITLTKQTNSPKAFIDLSLLTPSCYPSPSVSDSVNRILYGAYLKDATEKTGDAILELVKAEYFEKYIEANEKIHGDGMSFNWTKISRQNVVFNEDYLLSLEFSNFAFTGGAHSLLINKYRVVDLTDGSIVGLEKIFRENSSEKLTAILNKKLKKKHDLPADKKLSSAGFYMDTIQPTDNFYLMRSGIGFYYNNYEIAPFSAGHNDLFIPYEDLQEILDPEGVISRIYEF